MYGHASLRSVDVHTMQSYVVSAGYGCWREKAPRRAPNIAATLSCFALMSGTQPSQIAFVIVLVSRSRASLGVALSTCQLSLLAVTLWMGPPTMGRGVSKARGAEEPLGSGTMAHSAVGPSQVLSITVDESPHRC